MIKKSLRLTAQRTEEQMANHEKQFRRKVEFMLSIGVSFSSMISQWQADSCKQAPIWNGEFGPVYQSQNDSEEWEQVNESRLEALKHQLEVYARHNTSWSIWLWKGEDCHAPRVW
jgi:aryl-phospho-beta-D-glucosidase BglC (GH1 family)